MKRWGSEGGSVERERGGSEARLSSRVMGEREGCALKQGEGRDLRMATKLE
jgi:hypothetical protein